MQTALITHPTSLMHDMGHGHPESAARILAIEDQLIASGIHPLLQHHAAPAASHEQLARVHAPAYIRLIHDAAPTQGRIPLDPDTWMNPHSLDAALHAAGAAVLATDLVLSGAVENAFCNVRPPGHHACRNRAMGFCIFNNVAVGVAHALAAHGLTRVAIVDFDVHHGNGTEDIFRDDPRVLLCSSFQHPFYPHCGADSGNAHILNVPLPAYSDGRLLRRAFSDVWRPALDAFRPEMVFVSAGFDAHREDEMAGLNWVDEDYAWVTQEIRAVAAAHADRRIVSTLEGGYALQALGRCATAHIRILCGA